MTDLVTYATDADGIATITWAMDGYPMNVLNEPSLRQFEDHVRAALADAAVKGIVIASGKADFIAGADLNMLKGSHLRTAEQMWEMSRGMQTLLRELETGGKPVVAAINGTALGGGFEIALACHRRIAADTPKAQIGLPEVKLGLLPGGGGTQRLPRLIGARAALPLLLEGKTSDPAKAKAIGLVHEVVPADDLMAAARAWILDGGSAKQPWDEKGFKIPDGGVQTPKGYETFIAGNALLRKNTWGNYPAPEAIMACVYHGLQMPIEQGLNIESRNFIKLARGHVAQNMIKTLFFSIGDANKLKSRPKDVPTQKFTKVGILGAGMMGAGIAYVTAKAGIEAVLLDTDQANAEKGKAYAEALVEKGLKRKKETPESAQALLDRITPTTDYAQLAGCELVVEAVFENREIKADVTAKAEAAVGADAVFASNTSTLPITGLAEASRRPAQFIGLHFFSPVDKMPLVEIIMGRDTDQATLARSMDYVKAIKKTPIVVNDSRGFYTSRVFGTYVNEGLEMLREGVAPALIDNAGKMAGMPVGPLALADEVAIDLMYKIANQTAADLGEAYVRTAAHEVAAQMVDDLGRVGKKAGKGFYDYPDGGQKHIWPDLAQHFPTAAEQPDVETLKRRFLHIQAVETARCLAENVVTTPEDADVGSILGWGFAPFLGGTLSYIDTIGIDQFTAECEAMASELGARFTPPQLLRDMAAKGERFYPEEPPQAQAAE